MTVITKEHLMELYKAKDGVLLPGVVENQDLWDELLEEGYLGHDGRLTEKGLKDLQTVQEAVDRLKTGIPIGKRARSDPGALAVSGKVWHTGLLKKQTWFTDGSLLVIGKPDSSLKQQEGSDELRHKVPNLVRMATTGRFVEVEPYAYQVLIVGETSVVWLKGEGVEPVAIDARYHDYLATRFPKATYQRSTTDPEGPILVTVRNRGISMSKNGTPMVAMLMPITTEGTAPQVG